MKLSVIIPCYNADETIADLLEALAEQEWSHPWEVVVVDNRSNDNTVEIAGEFKEKVSNLVILDAHEKQGRSFARNKGVENARGEYIAFVDADDVVGENWLKNIGNALLTHDFVACRLNWTKLNDLSDHNLQVKPQIDGLIDFVMVEFLPFANGGTLGIKKSIHDEVGGFDEAFKHGQDVDYCWRVQLKGYKLIFITEAVIYMRARSTKKKVLTQHINWGEYNVYLYEKHKHQGMADYTIKQSIRSLYHILLAWRDLFSTEKKELWIIRFGLLFGRLKGMIKYKLIKHGLINGKLRKNIIRYRLQIALLLIYNYC